jgi:hypothetical protein
MAKQTRRSGVRDLSHINVSLHSPTWSHIRRKFPRKSHLASAFAQKRWFSNAGGAASVGSIPIARSIL